MTNEHMEQILLEALDLLEAGYSMEAILERFPSEAAELRPHLLTVQQLAGFWAEPSAAAQQESRQAFLSAASQTNSAAASRPSRPGIWSWILRPVLALLAVAFLGTSVAVAASGQAIPGDPLYGVKRFVEESRLALSPAPDQLLESLREERLREARTLLSLSREGMVIFTGTVEVITSEQWTVAGMPVAITSSTEIEGDAVVGRAVEVTGNTAGGKVVADRIVVLGGEGGSEGAEPVQLATPTPEVDPTPTLSATSTSVATPLPTATSAAADNDNANDDDAGNAEDGDDDNTNDDDDNANDGDDDNTNDDGGDDDDNVNGGDDDNANDDDSANDNDDDNANDDDGDDNANGGGDDDDGNDNDGDDDGNANDDNGNANDDDDGNANDDDDEANDDNDNANDDNANDNDDDNANDDDDGNANDDDDGNANDDDDDNDNDGDDRDDGD